MGPNRLEARVQKTGVSSYNSGGETGGETTKPGWDGRVLRGEGRRKEVELFAVVRAADTYITIGFRTLRGLRLGII